MIYKWLWKYMLQKDFCIASLVNSRLSYGARNMTCGDVSWMWDFLLRGPRQNSLIHLLLEGWKDACYRTPMMDQIVVYIGRIMTRYVRSLYLRCVYFSLSIAHPNSSFLYFLLLQNKSKIITLWLLWAKHLWDDSWSFWLNCYCRFSPAMLKISWIAS